MAPSPNDASRPVALPSPGIEFNPSFLVRLGRLRARWRAARERREGAGRAHLVGVGDEFVGYRPYQSGDDLRTLDWNLLARFDQPFVRVSRREASERWTVVLDTSASMGVGQPGKLQRAAEVAVAIAAGGAVQRARVELITTDGERPLAVERPGSLLAAMRQLETRRARGRDGLGAWLERGLRGRVGRLFLLGDFLDLEPAALAGRIGRGRELLCLAFLSDAEFRPDRATLQHGAIEWVDAESGERWEQGGDGATLKRYELRLNDHLENWRRATARHRSFFGCWPTSDPFERVVEAAVGL